MKKWMLGSFLLVLSMNYASAAKYQLDPSHTYPNFSVSHLGFSTMYGHFGKTSGTMEYDASSGKGSVNIIIDAASIYTGHKKRDKHLRSPDFFNVIEFPDITFNSTSAKLSGGNGTVEGELTMLGVTKSVVLTVSKIKCGKHPFNPKLTEVCGFDASTKIKRTDFGMTYGMPAIGDEISIVIGIEGTR